MLTVNDLLGEESVALTGEVGLKNEIKQGYACDMLSWTMSHAKPATAWVTVQNHMNVIAVASLTECACVILPEGIQPETEVLEKAAAENVAVLSSLLSGFSLCALIAKRMEA